jgi:hypothetical protein
VSSRAKPRDPGSFSLPRARGTALSGELCITGCWCWSYTRWHPLLLCHSERSEETRIFLGAKHFDFTEGMRSRAAHMQLRTTLLSGRCHRHTADASRQASGERSESYLAPVRMLRSARLVTRLARSVTGEAAPPARVRVQVSRERRPAARRRVGEGSATPEKCPHAHLFVSSRAKPRDPESFPNLLS